MERQILNVLICKGKFDRLFLKSRTLVIRGSERKGQEGGRLVTGTKSKLCRGLGTTLEHRRATIQQVTLHSVKSSEE